MSPNGPRLWMSIEHAATGLFARAGRSNSKRYYCHASWESPLTSASPLPDPCLPEYPGYIQLHSTSLPVAAQKPATTDRQARQTQVPNSSTIPTTGQCAARESPSAAAPPLIAFESFGSANAVILVPAVPPRLSRPSLQRRAAPHP
ncbi:hypothetical protein VTO42DRAFT_7387 [Malbranchea cinnamomea]